MQKTKSVSRLLIEARHGDEIRLALLGNEGQLAQYAVERADSKPIRGNIYLAKVSRVEPSLQAAFVDYGGQRNGFLAFPEINPDYYRIPIADRKTADDEDDADNKDDQDDRDSKNGKDDRRYGRRQGGGDDDSASRSSNQRYVIQDVIGQNRVLLVQITKDERGSKGAALTTYLSLASRYCVLLPNRPNAGGVSKQIDESSERRRLREIQDKLDVPSEMSVILRTAAFDHTKKEIGDDYKKLAAMWDRVRNSALSSNGPLLIHEETGILRSAIRDYYGDDTDQIVVDGAAARDALLEEIAVFMPSAAKKVKLYTDSQSLFAKEGITEQVDNLYARRVELPSGGSLVIDQSEAMIVIDVNSGRATRHRHIDDTALATNLEAATEIARQLRLRDLGGLVVIDFIDMVTRRHAIQVERALWDALKDDRARVQIGRITRFGLLEMTRQRLGLNLQEQVMEKCPHCDGAGWIRTTATGSVELLRNLEAKLAEQSAEKWQLLLSSAQASHFLNTYRRDIVGLEEKYATSLEVKSDASLSGDAFELQPIDGDKKAVRKPAAKRTRAATTKSAAKATTRATRKPTAKTATSKAAADKKPTAKKPPVRKASVRRVAKPTAEVPV